MGKKISLSVNIILAVIVVIMGVNAYGSSKNISPHAEEASAGDGFYECMENPIDPLFAQALNDSRIMAQYRQIQKFYYEIWKAQYEDIIKKIRKKCKDDEDIANYELFTREIEEGFRQMQPLILNEMPGNYGMSKSPEKNGPGNGTNERLLMYQGTMYRNACMFFIPFMSENEYTFPVHEVRQTLLRLRNCKQII